MKKKPKIAIVSLTSCEGCQFALLDLGRKFFDFLKEVDLLDFKLIEEKPFPKQKLDIVFVEGNPIKKEEIKTLRRIRKQAKKLVVLGNCAALGGIPEIKNYKNKEETIRFIYKKTKGIANPEIKEVDNFVKVDFTVPGCPINGEEFLKLARILIKGKIPKIEQKPVCSECSYRATAQCFLRKKEICFGPVVLAGCKAVCPENGFPCLACRGFLKNFDVKPFLKSLEKNKSREEIREKLEIFGLLDEIK